MIGYLRGKLQRKEPEGLEGSGITSLLYQIPWAEEGHAMLLEAGIRAEVDTRGEKLGRKVRDAQVQKVPWMLVVGKREAEERQVALRLLRGGDQGEMSVEEFIREAKQDIATKAPLVKPDAG